MTNLGLSYVNGPPFYYSVCVDALEISLYPTSSILVGGCRMQNEECRMQSISLTFKSLGFIILSLLDASSAFIRTTFFQVLRFLGN